ncbi:Aste57867_22896 [Aphanomyces stellatus]|uniref:Aste57867_22896 protein n=1 Tax=Aphanomyces stellatus TaxID=120398 RepID=A0A485LLZ6_9STRA|nr:hypothetical protein As57867_022825 [Aphanomyces stellatus]VFT99546.1 Aste57867_22896 [Aphanomyces stellatus]
MEHDFDLAALWADMLGDGSGMEVPMHVPMMDEHLLSPYPLVPAPASSTTPPPMLPQSPPLSFLERERQRKMLYRQRMKDEAAKLQEVVSRLEMRRAQLVRRRERRNQQTQAERQALAQWAHTVQTLREQNAATMQFNATLRESIRQQIRLAMSYQRTVRHALQFHQRGLPGTGNDESRRREILRVMGEQQRQLEHVRLKWHGLREHEDKCNVTFNASETDIAVAEIVRCRRFAHTPASVATHRIWTQLTGDTTHVAAAPRIAQRLDTIDPATFVTRVYMCDDVAPFGLNVVQHRLDLQDKHLIMYRTMDAAASSDCFHDVIQWDVVCWLEITADGDDTVVKEYICYTQLGQQAILPALLGCDDADTQTKLRAWMQQVVSKLYSGCNPALPSP